MVNQKTKKYASSNVNYKMVKKAEHKYNEMHVVTHR